MSAKDAYLIAHVVRGAPAFDIANRCDSMGTPDDPGPWWIIPTSGHRAYPYWSQPLYQDGIELWINQDMVASVVFKIPTAPAGWPDHYACNDQPAKRSVMQAAESILDVLGLRPKTLIRRRV